MYRNYQRTHLYIATWASLANISAAPAAALAQIVQAKLDYYNASIRNDKEGMARAYLAADMVHAQYGMAT